jgi:uncharacterized membrane protein YhfC
MFLLGVSIVIALLVSIVLPVAGAFWLNKKLGIRWKVITYGVLAYFIVQSLVTLLLSLFVVITIRIYEQNYFWLEIGLHVVLSAVLGVFLRWAAIRYIKEPLDNLQSAVAIGLGYGGIESMMIMGLPLLVTFISMLSNFGSELVAEAWAMSPLVAFAITLERLSALVMHILATVLILQVFKRKKIIWLAAAIGVEILFNGLIVGLSESGVHFGWVVLSALLLMIGNLYLLFKLHVFEMRIPTDQNLPDLEETSLDE